MSDLRLVWEPENTTPLRDIEERLNSYAKGRGVTVMANGKWHIAVSDQRR
jgi:hypothetical protein